MADEFGWRYIQQRMEQINAPALTLGYGLCGACGERVLQAVVTLHVREEHPAMAEQLRRAIRSN